LHFVPRAKALILAANHQRWLGAKAMVKGALSIARVGLTGVFSFKWKAVASLPKGALHYLLIAQPQITIKFYFSVRCQQAGNKLTATQVIASKNK